MSGPGVNEFQRCWEIRRQADFPSEPACMVTDDLTSGQEYYGGRVNGLAQYRILPPPFIPGQASIEHEMGHDIQRDVSDRTANVDAWIAELFAVRGAPLPTTNDARTKDAHALMVEQACSMLPEAFLGQWGGYRHPLYDNINDPVGAAAAVAAYFASPTGAAVRAFFRAYRAWQIAPIPPTLPLPQKGLPLDWLGPVPNTNFELGRQGNPVALIVIHWMAGSFDSALARFMTIGEQVSAHYLVSQTGRIVQVVRDADTAYHAGDFNTNLLSIGIEHEASPVIPPTDALYKASSWLLNSLSEKHGLDLVVGTTVLPHNAIVPTACPGTVDLNRLVEGADMTPEQSAKLDRLLAIVEAREALVWQARGQRFLDIETGKTYDPNKPPLDPRIKT